MEILSNCELRNFRLCNYNTLFASILGPLRFNISESSGNWKTSWQYSVWSENNLLMRLLIFCLCLLNALGLINTSTVFCNPSLLIFFAGAVIAGKQKQFLTSIGWHDRTTIANICYETLLINNKDNNCAWAWSFMNRFRFICIR
jgi:hypothetical protein